VLALRTANALTLAALAIVAFECGQGIESVSNGRDSAIRRRYSPYTLHTTLNIALFPLLFFFSGLYYTDVASTLTVLLAFQNSLRRMGPSQPTVTRDIASVFLGVQALLMRQTNVFWVVVFNGGLEAVHAIKTLQPEKMRPSEDMTLLGKLKFCTESWIRGDVHDPPLSIAWEDGEFSYLSGTLRYLTACRHAVFRGKPPCCRSLQPIARLPADLATHHNPQRLHRFHRLERRCGIGR
jgi:alpha-1,2-glucosyltransferase